MTNVGIHAMSDQRVPRAARQLYPVREIVACGDDCQLADGLSRQHERKACILQHVQKWRALRVRAEGSPLILFAQRGSCMHSTPLARVLAKPLGQTPGTQRPLQRSMAS